MLLCLHAVVPVSDVKLAAMNVEVVFWSCAGDWCARNLSLVKIWAKFRTYHSALCERESIALYYVLLFMTHCFYGARLLSSHRGRIQLPRICLPFLRLIGLTNDSLALSGDETHAWWCLRVAYPAYLIIHRLKFLLSFLTQIRLSEYDIGRIVIECCVGNTFLCSSKASPSREV